MAKTVLIVDDSMSLRKVVSIALTAAGYEVLEAGDGQAALDQLEGQKIHLILCDVNMPVMDGMAFLRALRLLPSQKFTPVIMLTTECGEDKKREGQVAGARAWMLKPFRPQDLLLAVAKLILP